MSEGRKDDQNKVRLDLLSPEWLFGTARVLTHGAEKYGEYNWSQGLRYSRVFGALLRHLFAWWAGEDLDPETGEDHLFHASCCLMFLAHYEHTLGPKKHTKYCDRGDCLREMDAFWLRDPIEEDDLAS